MISFLSPAVDLCSAKAWAWDPDLLEIKLVPSENCFGVDF